ncbi:MAG: hypothetical protein QNJ72_17665 [Pleurocapsa sp. MO_226.B13]|nr:hypothetical protein [Pleurocapsa sp. MO_226.B13]
MQTKNHYCDRRLASHHRISASQSSRENHRHTSQIARIIVTVEKTSLPRASVKPVNLLELG